MIPNQCGRRTFLGAAGGLIAGALSCAEAATRRPQRFRVGFAPATDGTLDSYWMRMHALSAAGLRSIEVDNGIVKIAEHYASRPAEFADRMAALNLQLVGVNQPYLFAGPYPGAPADQPSDPEGIRQKNAQVARFLSQVGATYLGWEGGLAPGATEERVEDEETSRRVARLANVEGRRVWEEHGVRFAYHTHSTFGFRRLMDLTNPACLSLNADLGWLAARGGGDATEILRAYRSRLLAIHFKDFDPNLQWQDRGRTGKGGMVVPGGGSVNFPAVVEFLKESEFDGFVLGEHIGLANYDFVRSPREVEIYPLYRDYFVGKLGLKL